MKRLLYVGWLWAMLGLAVTGFVLATVGILLSSDTVGGVGAFWMAVAAMSGVGWLITFPVCETRPPEPLPSRAGRQQMRRERRMRELEWRVAERERVTRLMELEAGVGEDDG